MSEVCVASDRFWREFKSDVAGTLSDAQRLEIQRVLDQSPAAEKSDIGDLRLSFKWFFVRLAWGPEKRNAERVKKEQAMHPAMSRRNLPMLATFFAGYMVFWYIALGITTLAFLYYMR